MEENSVIETQSYRFDVDGDVVLQHHLLDISRVGVYLAGQREVKCHHDWEQLLRG